MANQSPSISPNGTMAIGKLMADRIAVGVLEGDWVRLAPSGYVKVRNRYGEPALTPVGDAP